MPSLREVASTSFYLYPIEIIDIPEDVEAEYDSFSLVAAGNSPIIKNIQDRSIKKGLSSKLCMNFFLGYFRKTSRIPYVEMAQCFRPREE